MEKRKCYISNFTKFDSFGDGESKIKVIRDDVGTELGFEVRGTLTTFDVRNENGYVFTRQSYDKFVDDYFISNSLNVPLCMLHNDEDPRTLCGIVKSMTKTESGVEILNLQDLVNGIDWIAENFRGKLCVEVDIDRQSVTPFGTPAQIDALIRETVTKIATPEGGLCMIYGLYPGVPLENVKALMDAMERYCCPFG